MPGPLGNKQALMVIPRLILTSERQHLIQSSRGNRCSIVLPFLKVTIRTPAPRIVMDMHHTWALLPANTWVTPSGTCWPCSQRSKRSSRTLRTSCNIQLSILNTLARRKKLRVMAWVSKRLLTEQLLIKSRPTVWCTITALFPIQKEHSKASLRVSLSSLATLRPVNKWSRSSSKARLVHLTTSEWHQVAQQWCLGLLWLDLLRHTSSRSQCLVWIARSGSLQEK